MHDAELKQPANRQEVAAVSLQGQASNWLLHLDFDKAPRGVTVGGIAVIRRDAPADLVLKAHVDGNEYEVEWHRRSPRAEARFPDAPNAARARFRIRGLPLAGCSLDLMIHDPASKLSSLIATHPLEPLSMEQLLSKARGRITDLRGNLKRSESDRLALSATLYAVPPRLRDLSWLETVTLLDALFRHDPSTAFNRVKKIRSICHSNGNPQRFEEFWTALMDVLEPYALTPHGYTHALAGRDEQAVWRGVERIISAIASHGYLSFINSGTLLGAVRDGHLIAHDDDVDLAVILRAQSPKDLANEWIELKQRLREAGMLDVGFERERKEHCKLKRIAGVSVDLFPAWITGSSVYVWPHTFGDVPVSDLLPLRSMDIAGATVPAPRVPERLLVANYGPDWMHPDPSFRFDWSSAFKRFRNYVTEFKLARQDK